MERIRCLATWGVLLYSCMVILTCVFVFVVFPLCYGDAGQDLTHRIICADVPRDARYEREPRSQVVSVEYTQEFCVRCLEFVRMARLLDRTASEDAHPIAPP
jgi:hypothetical protein